ncbi:P-II family nitrogen regulator [Anaerobacillus sp. MEB173]|uniref:P-II family nitrogen regulator n=1 Tax=Anaerobacillus sp. MEB173 TaxID=3383345 RepID=UPI003F93BBEF
MNELLNMNHKLLITIVKKGAASKIVKATKAAGAEGGTILFGKGTGIHEKKTFLGITIEPEKELILTLVPVEKIDSILTAVNKAGKLDKPGNGIGFVVDVKKVAGIVHLLKLQNQNTNEGG